MTRVRLAPTRSLRQLTEEGRWWGSSAPKPPGFLQIRHPADAKTWLGKLGGLKQGCEEHRSAGMPAMGLVMSALLLAAPAIRILCRQRSSRQKLSPVSAARLERGFGNTRSVPSAAAGTRRPCPRPHACPHVHAHPHAPSGCSSPSPPALRAAPAAGPRHVFGHRRGEPPGERRQRLSLRSRRALPAPPHAGESRSHLREAHPPSRGLIPPPAGSRVGWGEPVGVQGGGTGGEKDGEECAHTHTGTHAHGQAAAPDRLLFAARSAGSRALNKPSRSIRRADLLPRKSP